MRKLGTEVVLLVLEGGERSGVFRPVAWAAGGHVEGWLMKSLAEMLLCWSIKCCFDLLSKTQPPVPMQALNFGVAQSILFACLFACFGRGE